mmetsp:Transcript_73222/g.152822  ORF Transcript_73222/g.152822 Transcript_73222/m.152822 type:complete len:217 (-) Transcript_73222:280-930(-)
MVQSDGTSSQVLYCPVGYFHIRDALQEQSRLLRQLDCLHMKEAESGPVVGDMVAFHTSEQHLNLFSDLSRGLCQFQAHGQPICHKCVGQRVHGQVLQYLFELVQGRQCHLFDDVCHLNLLLRGVLLAFVEGAQSFEPVSAVVELCRLEHAKRGLLEAGCNSSPVETSGFEVAHGGIHSSKHLQHIMSQPLACIQNRPDETMLQWVLHVATREALQS